MKHEYSLDLNHKIPDYLNGHLTPEEAAKFESLVEKNTELKHELKFQKHLKEKLAETAKNVSAKPQFSQIADKLESKPSKPSEWFQAWSKPAIYAAFASILCITVIATQWLPSHSENDMQYVTLSDSSQNNIETFLRIVAIDSMAFEKLMHDYNTSITQKYPNALTLDIKPKKSEKLLTLANTFRNDDRINLVQIVEPK